MRHLLVQNQMTADVVGHLRSISGQQSKIRGLRQKLQILREATAKQGTAVSHLLFVRRVPAVYRQCLAECMRRQVAKPQRSTVGIRLQTVSIFS